MHSVELSTALLCKYQETSQFQKEGGDYFTTLDAKWGLCFMKLITVYQSDQVHQ